MTGAKEFSDSDIRQAIEAYIDRYGWDVSENDEAWREYQRKRMADEYTEDMWEEAKPSNDSPGPQSG